MARAPSPVRGPSPSVTVPVAILLLAGCAPGPSFIEAPVVEANPNPAVPLAAVVRFEASGPVETRLSVTDGTNAWELDYDASHDPAEGLPVLGMRPAREHTITVSISSDAGTTTAEPLRFTTPATPKPGEDFPPVEITTSDAGAVEPGFVFFNPRRGRPGNPRFGSTFGMLLAMDRAGEPVWYYETDSRISDFDKIGNGNLLFVTQDYRLVEIDWLGNEQRVWYAADRPQGPIEGATPVAGTVSFHHEVDELPNGNFIILGSEVREIDNWYTSETDPRAPRKRQKVMGDIILEFEPDTGKVVWEWKAFDHLPVMRLAYETFDGYWMRRGFPGVVDWSHANNLLYDREDDAVLINFRYQAAIVKIDHETKEIDWIVADPDDWGELASKVLTPVGDTQLPYHQHSPYPTADGALLVFDNGNYRARPFKKPLQPKETWTRAVEYRIDEEARTIEQIWQSESRSEDSVVSIAMGDVQPLARKNNLLVGYGFVMPRPAVASGEYQWGGAIGYPPWTRIREYTRGGKPKLVWEAVIGDPSGGSEVGWSLFGVEHLAQLGAR